MHKLFQTVHEEHEDLIEGKITGTIPSWLSGSLYRNGPGIYEVGENKYSHWFDPMAMFHRFYVKDGKAYYQSKYLRSETYKRNMAEKRIVVSQFGTVAFPDPCKNIFQRFLAYFQADDNPGDNTNVAFYPVGDELYATTETNIIHRVNPDTLDTMGTVDLTKYVVINNASAHPHWDKDGTVHMIGNVYKEGAICIAKFPPKLSSAENFPQGEIVATVIRSNKMAMNYIHSYAMTDNYYVFVEQPLVINIWKIMLAKYTGTSMLSAMEWKPELKAKFHILDKKTGKEVNAGISYEADAFIVFHHGNAYEDNGHIVLDLCAISTDKPLQYAYLKNLQHEDCVKNWKKHESATGRRYVLPLNVTKETPTGQNLVNLDGIKATARKISQNAVHCDQELFSPISIEFPQINYSSYNGKKYKYTYGVGFHNDGPHFNTLLKVDLTTKKTLEWAEDNCYPSEPIFVPNPNGAEEDDGVILSAVNDTDFEEGRQAFLLILDARDMKELARVHFNVPRFPKDFHGYFRPTA